MAPKPRSDGWKKEEDEALCRARLICGGDPGFGINQRESTMWKKIVEHYELNRPTGGIPRDQSSCTARWKKINKECMMYSAAIIKAQKTRTSGQNLTDEMLLADSNYHAVAKKPFKLQHCWTLLKDEPKYQNPPCDSSVNLDDDDTPGSVGGTSSSTKPVGQKSKKAANQKEQGSSKRLDDYLAYAKERDAQRKIDRANELQKAGDMQTMLVDPSKFSEKKKKYWEMKQKVIMDREMTAACPTRSPLMNASTARNLFPPPTETPWIDESEYDN